MNSPLLVSATRRRFWTAVPVACLLTLLIICPGSSERLPVELDDYEFIAPVPGSKLVLPSNQIILRPGPAIDIRSLSDGFITVSGLQSGVHRGTLELCDDGKTVIFKPDTPFALGEQVIVRLDSGLSSIDGESVAPGAFGFTVTTLDPGTIAPPTLADCLGDLPLDEDDASANSVIPGDSSCELPGGYPGYTVIYSNNPDPGHVFLTPFRPPLTALGPLLMLDNLGQPIFYRQLELGAIDFRRQPDGRLTYADWMRRRYYALDENYAVVDSFYCGNGYSTDFHDLEVLPNGHALVFAYDPQPIRMDLVVPGGDPDATVIGLVIQEIDNDKNVIFQWRSWDHFDILDAEVSGAVDLTSDRIDYVHANAIEYTHDGNILISSRHLNEVTKIDRQTGQIIWRLGAHAKNNEFKFPNDSRGFSHQHDVREMHNGHISIYDNGNFLDPQYSRAVSYRVNENSRVAPMVWEYRHSPDIFGGSMGNVQRRKGGGSMIGWGGTIAGWKVTDLHEDGSLALEMTTRGRLWTYRAVRHEWRTTLFSTTPETLHFGIINAGDSATLPLSIQNKSAEALTIDCIQTTNPSFTTAASLPISLSPGESRDIEVMFTPPDARSYTGKLYVRTSGENEIIAQDVMLDGAGGIGATSDRLDVEPVSLGLLPGYPNPISASITLRYGLAASGPAQLAIYDVRGRKIRTLAEGTLAGGLHSTSWNRKDDSGRQVPAGIYVVRFSAGAIRQEQKLVVMP